MGCHEALQHLLGGGGEAAHLAWLQAQRVRTCLPCGLQACMALMQIGILALQWNFVALARECQRCPLGSDSHLEH